MAGVGGLELLSAEERAQLDRAGAAFDAAAAGADALDGAELLAAVAQAVSAERASALGLTTAPRVRDLALRFGADGDGRIRRPEFVAFVQWAVAEDVQAYFATPPELTGGSAAAATQVWTQAYDRAKAGSFQEALRLGRENRGLLNMQRERSGFTLLHQAAWHGASRAAEHLVLLGADRTLTDRDGRVAAAVARAQGHAKAARRIENAGMWLRYECAAVTEVRDEEDGPPVWYRCVALLEAKGEDWAASLLEHGGSHWKVYSRGYLERCGGEGRDWDGHRTGVPSGPQLPTSMASDYLRRLDDPSLLRLEPWSVEGFAPVGGIYLRAPRTQAQRRLCGPWALVDGVLRKVDAPGDAPSESESEGP